MRKRSSGPGARRSDRPCASAARPHSPARWRLVRSVLTFTVTLGAFALGIAGLMGNERAMTLLQRGIARVTSEILNLLGNRTAVVGTTIQSGHVSITVVTACTGLFLIAGFVAAVLAFPSRARSKVLGVGMGLVGISILNVLRLVSLYYIGVYLPGYLDLAHQLVWQSVLIVLTLLLWLFWAGRLTRARAS